MPNEEVMQILDELIRKFDNSLPETERGSGWDDDLWSKCGKRFRTIRQDIERGVIKEGQAPDMNLPRSLDHEGVLGGRTLQLIARFTCAYDRAYSSSHS